VRGAGWAALSRSSGYVRGPAISTVSVSVSLTVFPASRSSIASLYVPRSAGASNTEKKVPLPTDADLPSGDEPDATLLLVAGSMARQNSVYVCGPLPAPGRFEYCTIRSYGSLRCTSRGTRATEVTRYATWTWKVNDPVAAPADASATPFASASPTVKV